MRPEYPHDFDLTKSITAQISEESQIECSMLWAGATCGDYAAYLLLYSERDSYEIIAVCRACALLVETSGEATTAYWRAKQREWGVR